MLVNLSKVLWDRDAFCVLPETHIHSIDLTRKLLK